MAEKVLTVDLRHPGRETLELAAERPVALGRPHVQALSQVVKRRKQQFLQGHSRLVLRKVNTSRGWIDQLARALNWLNVAGKARLLGLSSWKIHRGVYESCDKWERHVAMHPDSLKEKAAVRKS